jgi:hypothetical protein
MRERWSGTKLGEESEETRDTVGARPNVVSLVYQ